MATPIHTAAQADYRLAQQCGADEIRASDVALSYRLKGAGRAIERIGGGWAEFGLQAGSVLETSEDVEGVRRLMAGRDPHTHRTLVKPKVATAPAAMLDAAPFVAALEAAAAERGVSPAALVSSDPWSVKRVGRLERGLRRDGEHHRAPVADLERVAAAAGVDLATVFEGQELSKAQAHRDERVHIGVRGYDVTFDRPKGISVLQGLAPEAMAARMEEIHLEAVRESVTALEEWVGYGMAGHHGDGQRAEKVATSGLVATMTVHRTARPVDAAPGDPHLHTHVMLANLARGTDGRWRTIAAGGRDLMRHVPAVGELYRALERAKLTEEFGLQFGRDEHTGRWDVVGIPPELKTVFSRRSAQVRETVGEGASAAQNRAAARATAREKVASTAQGERASWRERTHAAGYSPREVVTAALQGRDPGEPGPGHAPRGPRPVGPPDIGALAEAVWHPEHGVTSKTKVVTRAKVMAAIAGACGHGLVSRGELATLTSTVLAHPAAVALPASGASHMAHADRYTSADIVAAEETITAAAQRRRRDLSAHVHLKTIMRAERAWEKKKGFRLSKEQRKVVRRLTFVPHGIDTVVGVAGAGKTTIMSAARTIWESAGYRVEGAANAAVAAAGLRAEAGITSSTVASLLSRIETGRGLQGVDVLVLDEAATIDDRALAAIVTEANRTRTKIVGIGDPLQARAVGAGGAFARIHEIVDGLVLTENRRQKAAVDRKALSTWRQGGRRSALALWGEHGMIHAAVDADAAHRRITAAWAADRKRYADPHQAVERLAVLAATNADVDALNMRLREAARTQGHLSGKEVSYRLPGGRTLELAAGDQVRVRQNDYRSRRDPAAPDVLNGFRGVVLEVDARRGAHVEWRADGRTERAWIAPDQISRGALSHGYATTVASAQGMTVDRAHVYGLGADAHALYPAMSRARERVDLYLPACVEPETVRARLGEARTEEEALHRTISAYAATLTDGPEPMVLDELAGGRQVREERERAVAERAQEQAQQAPTPWQPLTLTDANAGHGPAYHQAAPEIAALTERRTALEQALPELRQRAQEAEQRADKGHLALLLEGTTKTAAQAERDAAWAQVDRAAAERERLRAQTQRLREQALAADRAQARTDRERAQREAEVARLEKGAHLLDVTRQELHRMDGRELDTLRVRHTMGAVSGRHGTARHEHRIEVPAATGREQAGLHASQSRDMDLEEYQRRLAMEIEQEEAERRQREQAQRDHQCQQAERRQREHAERIQREAAYRAVQHEGPGLSL